MPYDSISELPEKIRKALPKVAQEVFKIVVNHSLAGGESEETAFKKAWGAVENAGYEKKSNGKYVKKNLEMQEIQKNYPKSNEVKIVKVDSQNEIIYGWGMISKVKGEPYFDTDNQHFPDEVMLEGVSDFMIDQRINKNMHDKDGEVVGLVVHSFPLTDEIKKAFNIECGLSGWLVGVKPNSKDIIEKHKNGDFTGFSIGGAAAFISEEDYSDA